MGADAPHRAPPEALDLGRPSRRDAPRVRAAVLEPRSPALARLRRDLLREGLVVAVAERLREHLAGRGRRGLRERRRGQPEHESLLRRAPTTRQVADRARHRRVRHRRQHRLAHLHRDRRNARGPARHAHRQAVVHLVDPRRPGRVPVRDRRARDRHGPGLAARQLRDVLRARGIRRDPVGPVVARVTPGGEGRVRPGEGRRSGLGSRPLVAAVAARRRGRVRRGHRGQVERTVLPRRVRRVRDRHGSPAPTPTGPPPVGERGGPQAGPRVLRDPRPGGRRRVPRQLDRVDQDVRRVRPPVGGRGGERLDRDLRVGPPLVPEPPALPPERLQLPRRPQHPAPLRREPARLAAHDPADEHVLPVPRHRDRRLRVGRLLLRDHLDRQPAHLVGRRRRARVLRLPARPVPRVAGRAHRPRGRSGVPALAALPEPDGVPVLHDRLRAVPHPGARLRDREDPRVPRRPGGTTVRRRRRHRGVRDHHDAVEHLLVSALDRHHRALLVLAPARLVAVMGVTGGRR
ncbi:hypothetical protein PLANTIT3_60591 [Plantibacter sp. T3]|nr:hypothetical protein PLANTIT3_60591 [Plantibacter sp. T3]